LAPIDFLNGMTKKFLPGFPAGLVPDEAKEDALDIEFHWVNETGDTAMLTAGLSIKPTVSKLLFVKTEIQKLIVD
jgi:hypothetical protein